jgi:alanine-synthesizing transaminase
MFPKLDPQMYPVKDDAKFIYDLLEKEKILLVQGSAFNIKDKNHFRIVFLPSSDVLQQAISKIERFLQKVEF